MCLKFFRNFIETPKTSVLCRIGQFLGTPIFLGTTRISVLCRIGQILGTPRTSILCRIKKMSGFRQKPIACLLLRGLLQKIWVSYFALFIILALGACQTSTKKTPFFLRPLQALIKHHREETTHIDGPRCPLYPSCAAYAQRAIEEYGYGGFLVFIDRMVYRESGRLYLKYFCTPKSIYPSGVLRYYDPLEASLPFGEQETEKRQKPSLLKEDFDCYEGR